MPLYDFSCDCGYEIELIDSVFGKKVKKCPRCNNRTLVRLLGTGSGISFSSGYKDRAGQNVDFKEPYFDVAMRRKFVSAKDKAEFMNKNGIVQNGDSDSKVKKEKKIYYEQKMDTKKRS